jgi:hypothetical protein
MCRADVEPHTQGAVAHLLRDIAQSLADQQNADLSKAISVQCTAILKQSGQQRERKAIPGGTVCRYQGRRLASQSQGRRSSRVPRLGSRRCNGRPQRGTASPRHPERCFEHERYALLLEEPYEAAERLKQAHDAGARIEAPCDELAYTAETARRDLDRILNTGGVAALVGNAYGAAKDVGVCAEQNHLRRPRCWIFAGYRGGCGAPFRDFHGASSKCGH